LAKYLRELALISDSLRRAPAAAEKAGANDTLTPAKRRNPSAHPARDGYRPSRIFDAIIRAALFFFSSNDQAA